MDIREIKKEVIDPELELFHSELLNSNEDEFDTIYIKHEVKGEQFEPLLVGEYGKNQLFSKEHCNKNGDRLKKVPIKQEIKEEEAGQSRPDKCGGRVAIKEENQTHCDSGYETIYIKREGQDSVYVKEELLLQEETDTAYIGDVTHSSSKCQQGPSASIETKIPKGNKTLQNVDPEKGSRFPEEIDDEPSCSMEGTAYMGDVTHLSSKFQQGPSASVGINIPIGNATLQNVELEKGSRFPGEVDDEPSCSMEVSTDAGSSVGPSDSELNSLQETPKLTTTSQGEDIREISMQEVDKRGEKESKVSLTIGEMEEELTCLTEADVNEAAKDLSETYDNVADGEGSPEGSKGNDLMTSWKEEISRELAHYVGGVYSGLQPFKCTRCDERFCDLSKLRSHLKELHLGIKRANGPREKPKEKRFKCSKCKKKFLKKKYLVRHKVTHSTKKPYQCDECPKRFAFKENFNSHKNTHLTEKPYKCSACGIGLSSSTSLNSHMKRHTVGRIHQCSECPQRFYSSSYLKIHLRIHCKEKPFLCSECGMAFSRKCNLNAHMKTHTQEKSLIIALNVR